MQGTIGASCQFYRLEPFLEPLRPWRDERLTALAIQRWLQARPVMVLGLDRPPKAAPRPGVDPVALRTVARHLRAIAEANPSLNPNEIAGIAFFMVGNLMAGRGPTDYDDVFFRVVQNAPSERTRRRYRKQWGSDAGRVWWRDELQHALDVSALVNGGRTHKAALQWLRDNPGKHAHEAPPPRRRRAA